MRPARFAPATPYNPTRVDPGEFSTTDTYAGLADPTWRGRLCMRNSTEPYTQSVRPFWADQDGRGVHVNISGAGVLTNADHPALARRLIEWLATTGQNSFVDGNHEYPVNPEVKPEPVIARFGDFTHQPINAEAYGARNAEAVQLMREAGYR